VRNQSGPIRRSFGPNEPAVAFLGILVSYSAKRQEESMEKTSPAVAAHQKSIAYAMAGKKEEWLALFAEDAVVHDPVGPSGHDPEGNGFHGVAELSRFWDIMIAPQDIIAIPHKRINSGPNTAAVFMSMTNKINGIKVYIEMIAVYVVNDAGKLTSLHAYWDQNAVAAQMGGSPEV
jgi:steroid delta-isomerase